MQIKLHIVIFVLAALACTANVSILNPAATSLPKIIPSAVAESTQTLPRSAFDDQPVAVPNGISAFQKLEPQFQFVDIQIGWVMLSDTNSHTSLYKTTAGGQIWTAQVQ